MLTKTDIEKYFLAEKQLGLLFLIIGIVAILTALVFFTIIRTSFYKGAAIPLLLIGLLELVAGFSVYKRSDGDRIRHVYALDMNPGELKSKELPRMEQVTNRFAIYKGVEITLLVAAIGMILLFRTRPDKAFWLGLAIALGLQALIVLTADSIAEKRAREYTGKLRSFHP